MAAGIVLAGGRSSRFGRDKLAAALDGRTLLERAVAAVAAAGADPVLVVLAPEDARPLPPGARRIHDARAHDGPLAGVVAGLAALRRDEGDGARAALAIVVGGDMPTLVPTVLQRLLAALDDPAVAAAWLHDGQRPRPLPLALRIATATPIAAGLMAAGQRRLRDLPAALGAAIVDPAVWRPLDPTGASLRDVDVESDLAD